MANRTQTILNSAKNRVTPDIYEKVTAACGILGDQLTPTAQAKYVTTLILELSRLCTPNKILEIMRPCGHQCISAYVVETAKKLYADSTDMSDFLQKLNDRRIGGGQLRLEDGHIVGIYDKYYCGLAKSAKKLLPNYCECSAGWFEKLFSSVLGKDIVVIRRGTVLSGEPECTFQINFV